MPVLHRRALLAASAALPLVAVRTRPAAAAEFNYKIGNDVPATHPISVRMTEAAARVKAATGGRVEVQVFPNNQLGSDTDSLSQLRSGALEMMSLSGLILATLVPNASVSGLGFAFKDYETVWRAMDGRLGAYIRGEIGKRGLVAFERILDNGYRQITSSTHPIRTPGDLKGFKIRVPVSPLWTSMFEAFGAAPVSINFSEVYSALQTKLVEGQENPLTLIQIARLYEVQKSVSLTGHMWDGFWILMNRHAFDALPADLREVVQQEFNQAALDERADIARLNGVVTDDLKAKGLEFVEVDKPAFRAALRLAGFYADWRHRFGDETWRILEAEVGALA